MRDGADEEKGGSGLDVEVQQPAGRRGVVQDVERQPAGEGEEAFNRPECSTAAYDRDTEK